MNAITSSRKPGKLVALFTPVLRWLESIPYALLAIPLRLAVATVFWNSAMVKLASWDTAVALFTDEYRVPVLPPEAAAYMAVSVELSMPVLLVLGLATVIEVFVYPQAWPTHIQWAAMLLVLLARGAGKVSLDELIRRRVLGPA